MSSHDHHHHSSHQEAANQGHSCCHSSTRPQPWYRNKTVIVAALLGAAVVLADVVPVLQPFRDVLFQYVRVLWWAILLGLFLGGVVDYYVPDEFFSHLLARRKKRTILYAVLAGFLGSVCSHGILALAIQIHKKGASTPAVIAFLLASPWANLPLTLVMVGFFGITKALFIIMVALIVAMVTGLIYQLLERRGWVEANHNTVEISPDYSLANDFRDRFARYRFSAAQLKQDAAGVFAGMRSLSGMILWWIFIGTGVAAAAGAYISPAIFQQYMGPSLLGMSVTLVLATVLEVCSEGTAPMAFEIYRQTGALGNGLVFLMAGVATDYTEIGLLWHNVGRKAAIWLPVITVPQILAWGVLANAIF